MVRKQAKQPVNGGVRRGRTGPPMVTRSGPDDAIINYHTLGEPLAAGSNGFGTYYRNWIPGLIAPQVDGNPEPQLANATGPALVSYYSSARFLPGTRVRWEPSVSFNTSGRVFVAFTDNPEVAYQAIRAWQAYKASPTTQNYLVYAAKVKGMGSMVSFPVWQETDVAFPTRMRRKRFDTNATVDITSFEEPSVDTLDRCCQTSMFVCFDGVSSPSENVVGLGSFWFHDKVDVEGITNQVT